jgi:hypothetical protein
MTDNPEDARVRGYRDGYHRRICAFTNNKEYVRGWFEGKEAFWVELCAELDAKICSQFPHLRAKVAELRCCENEYPWRTPKEPPWSCGADRSGRRPRKVRP